MTPMSRQLISYIAPAAPATRRPAGGDEPFLRPEIGFTPAWYRQHLEIDFGARWHTDPAYRRETVAAMRLLLRQVFPGTRIACIDRPDEPLDLLTGVHGATTLAAIYGVPVIYASDNWPNCEHCYLSDEQADSLEPPDLDENSHFQQLLKQVDWIVENEGCAQGFVNWQGVLNNAFRLRGEQIFVDMMDRPDRAAHVFDCVCQTMFDAARRLHERQRESGVEVCFFTVSNCLVNMVSPELYRDLLLCFDQRLAGEFACLGIHNCAWNADPYLEHYASIPNLGYVDMGIKSNLCRARELFPNARLAVMYEPTDFARKTFVDVRHDFVHIARELGPYDIVIADIEAGTPDERVLEAVRLCEDLSQQFE
jgi:hypothetical protein